LYIQLIYLLRDPKITLSIFWIFDENFEESTHLPNADVLAAETVENSMRALEQFKGNASALEPISFMLPARSIT